jgi:hypothetical protein
MNHNPDEVWSRIKDSPLSEDTRSVHLTCPALYLPKYDTYPLCRNDILSSVTQDFEFSVHSMCTTTGGYEERAKTKLDAIKLLKKPEVWVEQSGGNGYDEDIGDARDLLDIVKRLCRERHRGKGCMSN